MESLFGECRCCLIKGNHRSLLKEYYIENTRVVFKETILQCFNVFLSSNSTLPTLICEECVRRLRDATNFRSLVLRTEAELLKTRGILDETEFVDVLLQQSAVDGDVSLVKQEAESSGPCSPRDPCVSDDEALVPGESALLARFARAPRRLPARHDLATLCPTYHAHLIALKGAKVSARSLKPRDIPRVSSKLSQALNAATLLENSSATLFKSKMRSGFPCFYCRDIFREPKDLRTHQLQHSKLTIYRLLSKSTADAMVVYADVTDLKCTICDEKLPTLDNLKTHLIDVHKKKYAGTDRVIPFRLEDKQSDFECQICGRRFETFGATTHECAF